MDDRDKDHDEEIVGIWHKCKVPCVDCGGYNRIREAVETNRIRRKDVEDEELNYCDNCGKLLI